MPTLVPRIFGLERCFKAIRVDIKKDPPNLERA
jgi:hypothetical protein